MVGVPVTAVIPEAGRGLMVTCPVCGKEYPQPLGHACTGPASRVTDYWLDALKLHALGRTAESVREEADTPWLVAGLAYVDGITPERERAEMLTVAGCMDAIAAAGLTSEQAYNLAGLDRLLGCPFAEFGAMDLCEVA